MTYRYFFLLTIAFGVLSCGNGEYDEAYIANPAHIHAAFQKYTDVIVYDIFSPPVASRNYAYASIAAYEVLAQKDSTYQSLVRQLRDLDNVPSSPEDTYSAGLATLEAFFHTAKHFIFSEQKLLDHRNEPSPSQQNSPQLVMGLMLLEPMASSFKNHGSLSGE